MYDRFFTTVIGEAAEVLFSVFSEAACRNEGAGVGFIGDFCGVESHRSEELGPVKMK